jgi:hypothetical protein
VTADAQVSRETLALVIRDLERKVSRLQATADTALSQNGIRRAQVDSVGYRETVRYVPDGSVKNRSPKNADGKWTDTTVAKGRYVRSISMTRDTRKPEYGNTAISQPHIVPHVGSEPDLFSLFTDAPA